MTLILALSIAGSMSHVAGQVNVLADEDEAAIVEALIKLETTHVGGELKGVRSFSSDNIGPLAALRIPKLGFPLLSATDIERGKREQVLNYVVIRSISQKDGLVTVRVSVVTEGRACFAPAFFAERSFTYVFQKSANEWVGRLARWSSPVRFKRSNRESFFR